MTQNPGDPEWSASAVEEETTVNCEWREILLQVCLWPGTRLKVLKVCRVSITVLQSATVFFIITFHFHFLHLIRSKADPTNADIHHRPIKNLRYNICSKFISITQKFWFGFPTKPGLKRFDPRITVRNGENAAFYIHFQTGFIHIWKPWVSVRFAELSEFLIVMRFILGSMT